MAKETGRKPITTNRKARHDYLLHDTFEAGIVLTGTEVKSLRFGRASLAEAYVTVDDGEVWLRNANITEYAFGTWTNHAPRRTRKLLLHSKQIAKLARESAAPGWTIIPLEMYFQDGYAKVVIALATGKREWDKRQTIAERDAKRETERALKIRNRRR
ncbi:MAG: SsrA-binding protein SmpB [Propionibacteriaceae bacterium]|jgi:SsrA-binding protein|nr:SsrA-binding protein SmpB [Propionibacteriaceae bacterium]